MNKYILCSPFTFKSSYFITYFVYAVLCLVAQSCPTLCDPPWSPPGSFVHGILQARILEWAAISFFRGSSPGIEPGSPALQADSLPAELPGKPYFVYSTRIGGMIATLSFKLYFLFEYCLKNYISFYY